MDRAANATTDLLIFDGTKSTHANGNSIRGGNQGFCDGHAEWKNVSEYRCDGACVIFIDGYLWR